MNKIIFEVAEDEESSSAWYIGAAFTIVAFMILLQMFGSVTPGLN